ncbi:MAG: methyltransferase domain-containing protein [Legionellaceae bacterium]|nr:methyltransferase domain-containing protein [Legionellaceae bacterium]
MFVKAMYNTLASQYDMADCFGAISQSHKCALDQITRANIGYKPHYKILDLGVGDGAFLRKLKQKMPDADYTGIDVSREMLKRAGEALPFTSIEASAAEATNYLPQHSQDLVLAHFINAYLPTNVLFSQAQMLARSNGYFSVITTTYESFPQAQQYLADFIAKGSILSNIVGHYYKAVVKNTPVASGADDLLQAVRQHQFEVIDHHRIEIPMVLNNIDELVLFGIEGAWFLNTLSIPGLPKNFLLQRIKRLFEKMFTFPYHDTHIIDVVLAKK